MRVELFAQETGKWDAAVDYLTQQGYALGLNIVAALAIFILGRWLAKALTALARRLMTRVNVAETLRKFLCNIAYALMLVVVIIAALDRLGVDTTSLAAVLAAAGLAVGLALQNSLANFAAGVLMILFRPFEVGNFIDAGGVAGVVEEIHIFSTLMRTGDNVRVIVPNGQIISGTIKNFSAKDTRRIDLVVGCGYDDNLKNVKQFLEDLIAADDRILADPEPVVAVNELAESSVNFVVRPWVNSSDYWDVRWDLTEQIKLGFDEHGFTIPYPSRDVHLHNQVA